MSVIKNKSSAEWLAVKKYCEERLAESHTENESDLDEAETAAIRGRIGFIREILGLDQENGKANVPKTNYT